MEIWEHLIFYLFFCWKLLQFLNRKVKIYDNFLILLKDIIFNRKLQIISRTTVWF